MATLNLKPTHKVISEYFNSLGNYNRLGFDNEGSVSPPFALLLEWAARQFKWSLIQQYEKKVKGKRIRIDGAVVDQWGLPHGYWEAKDSKDDLRKELRNKFAKGYPKDNFIIQEPAKAILVQNGVEIGEFDLLNADELVRLVERFFDYEPPAFDEWIQAEARFRDQLPELGEALLKVIDDAKSSNKAFQSAFADFYELCRSSINPNLSEKAVEEMLIQHILTERIFRTVFRNSEFTQRNVIAREIERVVLALTSQAFSREEFLKRFDHFYKALELRANSVESFAEKQTFLNNVYERFFQGFSVKVADTHGIVYTPESIVNFMVRSVEEMLKNEFGKSLSDENVHILDPFVGTGNFIVHIMDTIRKTSIEHKYRNELHCNEVMLLPYYVASMNIEHEFYEKTGRYEPFEGICLVDTFDMEKTIQMGFEFVTEENTERIRRQKATPITVVIGNPPYNVGQLNENDNNKNRKYNEVDGRVAETYSKDSLAKLKSKLGDPYVKAFRWASDKVKSGGVIAFVSNNSFLRKTAFDGMRKHLGSDFDQLYILDLGGNVHENPRLSGTTHNVFGIQVGVCISILVRRNAERKSAPGIIDYFAVDADWRKEQKYRLLEESVSVRGINWSALTPDENGNWLNEGIQSSFGNFISLGNRKSRAGSRVNVESIFHSYSLGVSTNRDSTVHDFAKEPLLNRMHQFANHFNSEVIRFREAGRPTDLDNFLTYDEIKWSRNLKRRLKSGQTLAISGQNLRPTLYRPFCSQILYFAEIAIDELGQNRKYFPNFGESDSEIGSNITIGLNGVGSEKPFSVLASKFPTNLAFLGGGTAWQVYPYYVYTDSRNENISDWVLAEFRAHYSDSSVSKWNIFHYIYGILHHPEYREKYAANLKRELPRIPYATDFWGFAKAGKELMDIHVNYEDQPEYKLEMIENGKLALDWNVEKMKYNSEKTEIIYNDFLTIGGIPSAAHEYRLGNRSALDWIVDQYKVSTDKRSGITNDPNREGDPQYIVRLIKKIVTVSLRTNQIVAAFPSLE